ncbi:hypothetical protein ACP4OV_024842 [Aristida adscensionis]
MIAVLQLCVGRRCLVYQIIHGSRLINEALQGFLGNPDFLFVGFGIDGDAQKLLHDYGLWVANTADLNRVAAELGQPERRQLGMKAVAREMMGVEIEKPERVRRSRWDAPDLTQEQIAYATMDAYVSYEVGRLLLSGQ